MNNVKNYLIEQLEDVNKNVRIFKDDPDAQEMKSNSNRELMYFILRDKKEEQLNINNFGGIEIKEKTFEIIGITDKYRNIDKLNNAIDNIILPKLKGLSFVPNVKINNTKIINAYNFKTSYEGVADNKNDMIYSLSFRVTWE